MKRTLRSVGDTDKIHTSIHPYIHTSIHTSQATDKQRCYEHGVKPSGSITAMRRITTFRSTTDPVYDGRPIVL
jgi:hypothetical protein